EYGTFAPTDVETAPSVYYVLPEADDAIVRLRAHGVVMSAAPRDAVQVERFVMDSTVVAERPFQGHNERTVYGSWQTTTVELPTGTVAVRVDQPLGRLAFTLLEPRSDDGFANWALLDEQIEAGEYPVLRSR
ncbi:MAG: peptidase M14, partial [Longimicrobiales bacterium]